MTWDEQSGQWVVRIRRPSADDPSKLEEFEDRADVVLNGSGGLSRWDWPDIKGLHDFKGPIVHSAGWDFGGSTWEEEGKDWGDKNVVVIGLVRSILISSLRIYNSTHDMYRVLLHCRLWQRCNPKLENSPRSVEERHGCHHHLQYHR